MCPFEFRLLTAVESYFQADLAWCSGRSIDWCQKLHVQLEITSCRTASVTV